MKKNNSAFKALISILLFSLLISSCSKEDELINGPKACFITESEIQANLSTLFEASCSDGAIAFHWDFGDGQTDAGATVNHSYQSAREYEVSLTVLNTDSISDKTTQIINVTEPVIFKHMSTISQDEVWDVGCHILMSSIRISEGATLTIMPGAVVKFDTFGSLIIGGQEETSKGTLIAKGIVNNGILFTANTDEPIPGYLRNIFFSSGATENSVMKYCTVENGQSDYSGAMLSVNGGGVAIDNCTFRLSEDHGVALGRGKFTSFTNNTMEAVA